MQGGSTTPKIVPRERVIGQQNKSYLNVIKKYNLRPSNERLSDFRETLVEIVDSEHHGKTPRDFTELDAEDYGKCKNQKDDKATPEREAHDSKSNFNIQVEKQRSNFDVSPNLNTLITASNIAPSYLKTQKSELS